MGIYSIKPWFRQQLQPLIKVLWNVHPDVLTWSALGLSALLGFILYASASPHACFLVCGKTEAPAASPEACNQSWLALTAMPLFFVRLALNALDGLLAQQTGKARVQGEVLNELSDRFADTFIFLGITLALPQDQQCIGFTAMILMLINSYTGLLGKAVGTERVYTGMLGKADRMILLMVACLAYGFFPNFKIIDYNIFGCLFLLMIPMAIATFIQRLTRILALLKAKQGAQA
jgi:phosphatidylglycerophosphate synthase